MSNATTLVSRGAGPLGPVGEDQSGEARLSHDGARVTFSSDADNLSADDNDAWSNVFARDLASGVTTLVSRAPGAAGPAADENSTEPAISGDGRFVSFLSDADNLLPNDNDFYVNAFRRDLDGWPPASAAPAETPTPAAPSPATTRYRCAGQVATIVGTNRGERIVGTKRGDVIVARGGNDIICLGNGHDRAFGGNGNDRIYGGLGNDKLSGQRGRDRLFGNAGRDRIVGGRGNDRMVGQRGRDLLVGATGRDLAIGGPARDRCSAERTLSC